MNKFARSLFVLFTVCMVGCIDTAMDEPFSEEAVAVETAAVLVSGSGVKGAQEPSAGAREESLPAAELLDEGIMPGEANAVAAASQWVCVRAHATTCYNVDGTVSTILSNTRCGDGCGVTHEVAQYWAAASLASQGCIGPYPGCCEYYFNEDFNYCGG